MRRATARRSASVLALFLSAVLTFACGSDDDDGPAGPSNQAAALAIEAFTATSTAAGGGTFNYRASLRLRETAGAPATITAVTLTVIQTSGVSVSQDLAPSAAFPSTTVPASGTVDSTPLTVNGAPIQASQVSVRVTYSSPNGTSASVQATASVTAG